jgi:excisionase family DNA binding protein
MPEELLINVIEAARRLGIGRSKLYQLIGKGEIASLNIGKSRRVVVADLTAFVERRIAKQGVHSGK